MSGPRFSDMLLPPLRDVAAAVPRLLDRIDDAPGPLGYRLAPDGFSGGEHLACALGFVARTLCPLTDRAVPENPMDPAPAALRRQADAMRRLIDATDPAALDAAPSREVRHVAGEAALAQSGLDYATRFALPNARIHLTLGYASLRAAGAAIGKADLDGFHRYAPGTSLV